MIIASIRNRSREFAFAIGLSFVPSLCFAGVFGPANYDECILKNMQGVTSDVAARLVAASCRSQFDKKTTKPLPGICKVYWDGFKFLTGDAPSKEYETYLIQKDGIDVLELSVPKQLSKRRLFESQPNPDRGNFGKFFAENHKSIGHICQFN